MESQASAEAPQRRKLNLKPRDESAASKAEADRKSARSVRGSLRVRLPRPQIMQHSSGWAGHAA